MNNTGKILTALAVGVVAGAVLGILFAPDKGSETRSKISEQGKKFGEALKDELRKGKEKFDDMKEDLRKAANGVNDFEDA
jgi:gas vesicle protein